MFFICRAKHDNCRYMNSRDCCTKSNPDDCEQAIECVDPKTQKVLIVNEETGDYEFYKTLKDALESLEYECNNSSWLEPDCYSIYYVSVNSALREHKITFKQQKQFIVDKETK